MKQPTTKADQLRALRERMAEAAAKANASNQRRVAKKVAQRKTRSERR